MDDQTKEKKLRDFAREVLHHPTYEKLFEHIFTSLGITEAEVLQTYVDYDMDVFAYENEIYESLPMRAVLYIKYLMQGSWHIARQEAIRTMIEKNEFETVVDIGFGAPTQYLTEVVLKRRKPKATLADLYESAFTFSRALFNYLDSSWQEVISFQQHDMNTNDFIGSFDAYIFQDSVEHTLDPTRYLTNTVKLSPPTATFILSLPIGPKIPAHYIEYKTIKEANDWLAKCGLQVESSEDVYINPKVDLFADQLTDEFFNYIVECKKVTP